MFDTRRPILGRTALGLLAVGAALALSACGPVPLLPPALSGGRTVEPGPVDPTEPEPRPTPTPEPTDPPAPTDPPGPEDVNVFDLEEGDCIAEYAVDGGEGVSTVPVIGCGEPHLYEIYHAGDLDGDEYPGQEEVIDAASQMCEEEFDRFVGVPLPESELDYTSLFPTEGSWNDADDREVLCLVHERNGDQVSGGLEGARR